MTTLPPPCWPDAWKRRLARPDIPKPVSLPRPLSARLPGSRPAVITVTPKGVAVPHWRLQ